MNNKLILIVAMILMLSGCLSNNSKPASFYVLNADINQAPINNDKEKAPAVEIAALHIPPYLDRKQIVIRQSENRLHFSESNRWGGKLRKNLSRVLVKNLSHLLQSSRIAAIPHSLPIKPQYQLEVTIIQFERNAQGYIELSVQWRLVKSANMSLVASATEDIVSEELISADDYQSIVSAMSDTFARFSKTLAITIVADAK
ncbi:MAG: membrane integrity-associated transporter subunit PqiC [Gammaproteobacteria bacterium]|nr:membrane integrity-associated transporter subunit PqiC [Gammaproteobacteria bacterium]